ncbi:MAG TPA: glycoside hydrolase family 43 protein, partial [Pyrinomonadaceae bacterium]
MHSAAAEGAKGSATPATYQNPLYRHSFPDPFVLRYAGRYYAYATGSGEDGIFQVLTSDDLVNWSDAGYAMPLPAAPAMHYWAPEVTYSEGKFYLYYSVGNEILMELRVAVSDRPEGPFADAGVKLTHQDFAIDPHVFIDCDGTRWLFYATDFLDHSHIGTGTVVDRMVSWTKLEGKPRPVTRAKFDWQIYDPERKEKGGVRWHTVEGPAVIERKGHYFEMFSGGNWQNISYGVSFAVTDDLKTPDEWEQHADGDRLLPIIRTTPGVAGPGHNSIVRGPNGRELYCVYHRWTDAGRVMAIDRMDIVDRRLYVAGPTTTPQPMPFAPKDLGSELPSSCLIEFFAKDKGKVRLLAASGKELCSFKPVAGREYRIEIDGRWCAVIA